MKKYVIKPISGSVNFKGVNSYGEFCFNVILSGQSNDEEYDVILTSYKSVYYELSRISIISIKVSDKLLPNVVSKIICILKNSKLFSNISFIKLQYKCQDIDICTKNDDSEITFILENYCKAMSEDNTNFNTKVMEWDANVNKLAKWEMNRVYSDDYGIIGFVIEIKEISLMIEKIEDGIFMVKYELSLYKDISTFLNNVQKLFIIPCNMYGIKAVDVYINNISIRVDRNNWKRLPTEYQNMIYNRK